MEIPYFHIHVESYVWQKDHYILQFFARYSCTYCCTGGMIKVFLFYPLSCIMVQKILLSCAPIIQQVQNRNSTLRNQNFCVSYLEYSTRTQRKNKTRQPWRRPPRPLLPPMALCRPFRHSARARYMVHRLRAIGRVFAVVGFLVVVAWGGEKRGIKNRERGSCLGP